MNQLLSNWHMHRMGMVDFWYYVNEEFHFKNGHMLLRGSNGSGKSVTMQSFIPLLLDGNKSSERLDPFGTRSRKIENYLLEENSERNDRIGYLYIEFKREDSDVYKTIGMGLHAKKGKNLDAWYFVIEDNKRINRDFSLLDHNLAITKQVLKNNIGEQQVIEGQKAYMEKVNQALFGFKTVDEYKEAITLLLQLRSPKLSNSLKPSTINEILSDSLQPLSEDDLRPMSEAITNMDMIKDQLDALKVSHHAAKNIHHVFEQYAYAVLFDKYHKYKKEEVVAHTLQKTIAEDTKKLQQQSFEKADVTQKHKDALQEQVAMIEEKKSLGNDDVLRLSDECDDLRVAIKVDSDMLDKKQKQEETKADVMQDIKSQQKVQKDNGDTLLGEIQRCLGELDDLNERMCFEEHIAMRNEILQNMNVPYDFGYTHKQVDNKLTRINEGVLLFQKYDMEEENKGRILEQIAQQEDRIEHEEVLMKSVEEQYDTMVEEYKEMISSWNKGNQILRLADNDFHLIMEYLHAYEECKNYFEIHRIVNEQHELEMKKRITMSVECKENQKIIINKLHEKEMELKEWIHKEDPQPVLCEAQQKNRDYLMENAIPYRSFYSILEFADDMDKTLRNKVEETFDRLGILDALLVEEKYRTQIFEHESGMQDNYIFIETDLASLGSQCLQGATMKEIEASLHKMLQNLKCKEYASITMGESHFCSGIVLGTRNEEQTSIYIGKKTREAFREQKIKALEIEKEELDKQNEQQRIELARIEQEINLLQKEKDAFPKENDLHLALQEYKNEQQQIDAMRTLLTGMQQQEQECVKRLQEVGLRLQEIAGHLSITLRKEVFHEQKESYEEYRRILSEIQSHQPVFIKTLELLKTFDDQIENLFLDINELHAENESLQDKIKLNKSILQQKQKQLDEMGYEDICRRLREIDLRLDVLPTEISDMDKRIGALENSVLSIQQRIEDITLQEEEQCKKKELYYQIVKEEAQLGYVNLHMQEEQALLKEITELQKSYGILKDADELKSDVQTIFYNNRGYLQEYHLTITNENQWTAVDNISARLDIRAKYKGVKITFPELLENLETDIELQGNLLIDSDRHLFEDILVNILSKKVRIRIQNSRDWVNHMNVYMDGMNTSSGLKLNLQWKSKKAESDEELDTKKLVEILEKDQKAVKESDLEKLSLHFRTKIANARKLQGMEDNDQSFHQLMREIMDYRQWYEFKIMAQKTGEAKKELTNTTFYAFSGGEKAMAMYIPLFSAVAAKFKSAREDAPLLIALDEAFAGVDEKNISNMFALIEKFGFDYIMNSQVLWGDYPSVKALTIYELFRPENAHFVTVIPYEWDGFVKRMKG